MLLTNLPEDILYYLTKKLELKSLITLKFTCKLFYNYIPPCNETNAISYWQINEDNLKLFKRRKSAGFDQLFLIKCSPIGCSICREYYGQVYWEFSKKVCASCIHFLTVDSAQLDRLKIHKTLLEDVSFREGRKIIYRAPRWQYDMPRYKQTSNVSKPVKYYLKTDIVPILIKYFGLNLQYNSNFEFVFGTILNDPNTIEIKNKEYTKRIKDAIKAEKKVLRLENEKMWKDIPKNEKDAMREKQLAEMISYCCTEKQISWTYWIPTIELRRLGKNENYKIDEATLFNLNEFKKFRNRRKLIKFDKEKWFEKIYKEYIKSKVITVAEA